MAEAFKWSGEHLNWPPLASYIRGVHRRTEELKAAGYPAAQEPALPTHAVVRTMIAHFLGDEWFERNVIKARPGAYFYPNFEEVGAKAAVYTSRIFNLAECLFSLQYTENFRFPLQSLWDEDHIESAVAELQVGMTLFQEMIPFRYLEPSKLPGVKTPDIELSVGNRRALAEVKCKINDYVPGCLKTPFEQARKQIGTGNKGIFFVRVPQTWSRQNGSDVLLPQGLADECRRRMSGTDRIVRTVFYLFHLERTEKGMVNRHAYAEFASPRNGPGSPWNQQLFRFNGRGGWLRILDLIERALNA